MNYSDYIQWKEWNSKTKPFGAITYNEKKRYDLLLKSINIKNKNLNILEIGFGNGEFLQYCSLKKWRIEGIEIQKNLVDIAKSKGFSAYRILSQAKNTPYDIIAAFDVFEHMSIHQIKKLFSITNRILKTDGKIIARFPNADSFAGLGAQNGDYTHITALAQSKLKQLSMPYNLEIIYFHGEKRWPVNHAIESIRKVFRYIFIKSLGIGNSYYFSTNVIAVLQKTV